jgi:hypothetical protein
VHLKVPFRPAQPNMVFGALSPFPLHRGRSEHAREGEKRGGEWLARCVIDTQMTPNHRLSRNGSYWHVAMVQFSQRRNETPRCGWHGLRLALRANVNERHRSLASL